MPFHMKRDAPEPMNRMTPAWRPKSLAAVEREHILFALEWHMWIVKRACDSLIISRPTLYARLKSYGVDVKAARKEALK